MTGAYAVAVLPSDIGGSAFGLLLTIFLSLAATSTSIVGFFFDNGLFDQTFLGLAGAATVSALICYRLRACHDIG